MKECILCKRLTNGSIGTAGLKWSMICQPCKNKEDKILNDKINNLNNCIQIVGR